MNTQNQDIDALAAALRSYLIEHPNAADTLEGIARWWLAGEVGEAWFSTVQRAVEQLVMRGEMARQTLGDGTVVYERIKQQNPS
jgi:hypothetical protein